MEHLEALFEQALDAVVGMDDTGLVIAWNHSAELMFGWGRREALGEPMGSLIVPLEHRGPHNRGLEHYNRTGEGPLLERRIKITALRRNGIAFPVELSIFPVQSDHRKVFYAFIRSLETEEQFRREQELRAREADAVMHIGQRLIEAVPLNEFTQECLVEVCEIAGMDAAHMFFVRGLGAAQRLVPSGIWYLRDERFRPIIAETARHKFGIGQGLPGQAWETGQLEMFADLVNEGNFLRRNTFAEVGLTRAVALPVVGHGGETRAVLEFFGTDRSRLDPDVLRMLKTVGTQIGAAIIQKEGAEHRETLRREMVHRIGNSLTVLAAIYRNCSRRARSKDELDEAFLGRVTAMGRATRTVILESEHGAELPTLIHDSLSILPEEADVVVKALQIYIPSQAVMPISLVLNELATNWLKYGASDCILQVETLRVGRELRIEWREIRQVPLTAPPPEIGDSGFGTQLLKAMIEGSLGGSWERNLNSSGFEFVMVLPWDEPPT